MDLQTSWNSVFFKPVSSVIADSEDGGGGKTPVGCGDTRVGVGGLMALLVLALSSNPCCLN